MGVGIAIAQSTYEAPKEQPKLGLTREQWPPERWHCEWHHMVLVSVVGGKRIHYTTAVPMSYSKRQIA